jgi:hypothetical protein
MFTHWQEILPAVIENLSPLHRDIVMYLMNLPGKRKPAYSHAKQTWSLSRDQFDGELEDAFAAIRDQLKQQCAITSSSDLKFV